MIGPIGCLWGRISFSGNHLAGSGRLAWASAQLLMQISVYTYVRGGSIISSASTPALVAVLRLSRRGSYGGSSGAANTTGNCASGLIRIRWSPIG